MLIMDQPKTTKATQNKVAIGVVNYDDDDDMRDGTPGWRKKGRKPQSRHPQKQPRKYDPHLEMTFTNFCQLMGFDEM